MIGVDVEQVRAFEDGEWLRRCAWLRAFITRIESLAQFVRYADCSSPQPDVFFLHPACGGVLGDDMAE
jgi:hypothetical protein